MKKDKLIEDHEFQVHWLSHANADVVFEWLREQKPDFQYQDGEIEKTLIERHEPLINLGVALYANLRSKTALSLFKNGDRTIKKAVLAGPSVKPSIELMGRNWVEMYGVLKELLESFDEELLKSFLSNEFICDGLLVDLYERRELFESLTDEQWLKTLGYTTSNPRLSIPYDESWHWRQHVSYLGVFAAGWKLFETLPVDEFSAVLLSDLGERLVPDQPHDMDVFATIKRWEVESDSTFFDNFEKCRYVLARLIREHSSEFESLKDNDDLALRQSYYSRFSGSKPEEVRELFEKDSDKFLEVAVYNPKLYINEAVRKELSKCCWDYESPYQDLDYPNTFKRQVERFTQEHPEWFADYDGDIPINAVEDPVLRANKHLEFLQQQIKIILQKLIGSESENQLSLIGEVKTALSESNQLLSEQLSKLMAIRWGWLIVGLLIGYLLAKWL